MNPSNENRAADAVNKAADPFDTSFYFTRWQVELAGGSALPPDAASVISEADSEFYIGSFPGSNCEVNFEGLLQFDGYSIGDINSPRGTLVLTRRGRIEADINVRVAVINGWVTGNITGTDRVVLESEAKVTGHIYTPALSIRLGAIFDGDCLSATAHKVVVDRAPRDTEAESFTFGDLAVGVGA